MVEPSYVLSPRDIHAGSARRYVRADGVRVTLFPSKSPYPRSHDTSCSEQERGSHWIVCSTAFPDGAADVTMVPRTGHGSGRSGKAGGGVSASSPVVRDSAGFLRLHRSAVWRGTPYSPAGAVIWRRSMRGPVSVVAPAPSTVTPERVLRWRSAQRARKSVVGLVRANLLTSLLTFTNGGEGEGWVSCASALDDVSGFLRVHGERCFGVRPWVLVAERGGKGGRVHVHAVTWGRAPGEWFDYDEVYRRYSSYLTNRGYVSPTGGHRWHFGDEHGAFKRGFKTARWAAFYLAKYITKSTDEFDKGVRRYRFSGVNRPEVVRVYARNLHAAFAAMGLSRHDHEDGSFDFLTRDGVCVRWLPILSSGGLPGALERFFGFRMEVDNHCLPSSLHGADLHDGERSGFAVWRKGCSRPCVAM